LEGTEAPAVREVFALPDVAAYAPALASRNSLSDPTFDIVVGEWRSVAGARARDAEIHGAVVADGVGVGLLPKATWGLLEQERFRVRTDAERAEAGNRRHWGRIRSAAVAAGARLDDFLFNTVILTPEKLQIGLRKEETGGSKVVEVTPTFDGAPDGWLKAFDTHGSVLDRYNIATPNGIVAIEIAPHVKTVLDSVKRMAGRRVAGPRAEAFLVNPFAALGEDASQTIDEAQFMEAREKADLLFDRFFARIDRDPFGYPTAVALRIESARVTGPFETEVRPFADDAELAEFVAKVEWAIAREQQLCGWEGYDFEIMGETAELGLLRAALAARSKQQVLVNYASIYDLSLYSGRIEGIGEEKPFYSPYIAKKDDDEGWFPENILPVISWIPEGESEPVAVPVTSELREQIKGKTEEAIAKRQDTSGGFGHRREPLPGGRLEARARGHPPEPRDEIGRVGGQRPPPGENGRYFRISTTAAKDWLAACSSSVDPPSDANRRSQAADLQRRTKHVEKIEQPRDVMVVYGEAGCISVEELTLQRVDHTHQARPMQAERALDRIGHDAGERG
jgi:hypothetical protein